jgi:hypothetical protein
VLKSLPSDWDCHTSEYVQDYPIGVVSPTTIGKETLRGTVLHGSLKGLRERCVARVSKEVPWLLRWAYDDLASDPLEDAVAYLSGGASLLSRNAYRGARYFWAFEQERSKCRSADGNSDVVAYSSLWELAALVASGLRAAGLDLSRRRLQEVKRRPNESAAGGQEFTEAEERVLWAEAYCGVLLDEHLVKGEDRESAKCFVNEVCKKRWLGGDHATGGTRKGASLGDIAMQLWRGRLN